MKKRIFALFMIAAVLLGLLAACGEKDPITQEQAQKIALEHAGLTKKDVSDVHTHIVEEAGIPCYSIHITTDAGDFSVVINASTGEVLK